MKSRRARSAHAVVISIIIPTTLTYTGQTTGDFNDPATLAARLTDTNYGTPIANQSISLQLDSQPACTATTDN